MYYYKTTDQEAIGRLKQFQGDQNDLIADAKSFVAGLASGITDPANVAPIFISGLTDSSFCAIAFKNGYTGTPGTILDPALWTKPRKENNFSLRPRVNVKAPHRELQRELLAVWERKRPTKRVDRDSYYSVIGAKWTDYVFTGGTLDCVLFRDALYIKSSRKVDSSSFTEITGSEFDAVCETKQEAA